MTKGRNTITQLTRRNIFDYLTIQKIAWAGRISGRIIYGGVRTTATHDPASALRLSDRTLLEDPTVLRDHLERVRRTITSDPPAAIAAARELVESNLKVHDPVFVHP